MFNSLIVIPPSAVLWSGKGINTQTCKGRSWVKFLAHGFTMQEIMGPEKSVGTESLIFDDDLLQAGSLVTIPG
jgi:hypothetical protein